MTRYFLIPMAAAMLLAAGCGHNATNSAPAKAKAPAPAVVAVAAVTNASWDKTVPITGTLYAKDTATIAAQVEGQVEKTLVDFGDRVQSGQELASIDTASYQALLEQATGTAARAEASFRNAKQNFDRVQQLRKGGVASESDFDASKAAYDQADAELKAAKATEVVARLNVQRSRVEAPFDGAISQRMVGRGDFVKVGSPLFGIVNDAVLKFIFPVTERYASYVQKKLPVQFSVDNYPGEAFTGSVYLISPEVNQTSRAFNVGALVTNTNFRLKANTFARGQLVLQRAVPTPAIPVDAIVNFAGVTKVFVVENGVAHSRSVKTGRIQQGFQEVLEGLKAGESVVVSGQSKLSDGVAVTIRDGDGTEQSLALREARDGGAHGK